MQLRRRAPVLAALCALVASVLPALTSAAEPEAAAATDPRPNIVVVMADDMRFDDLQFTPFLRRLARGGTTFDNAFSNFPLCCPARASYWTGQLAHNHGVFWHNVPYAYGAFDDSRTLATALSAAGYRTGFIGKYLNRYGADRSLVSGEPSATYVPDGWTDWYAAVDGVRLPGVSGGTHHYFDTTMNINGDVRQHPGVYQTNLFGLYARTLMRRYAGGSAPPFFLNVHFVAPHAGGPREPDDPGELTDADGSVRRVKTPARPPGVHGSFDRMVDRAQGRPRGGGPSEPSVTDKPGLLRGLPEPTEEEWSAGRELTRQRAESLRVLDGEVRRTVAALKDAGEWDDTVLVVTSDNGYFLGEHRKLMGKVHGYEPSLRIPLVMTGPGVPRDQHRSEPASIVDLSATVLDLADARPPRRPDGRSLLPVLAGRARGWRTAVPVESAMRVRLAGSAFPHDDARFSVGVRTARYTYIRYVGGFEELYDLARDRHQLRSLAGRPAYRDERRALRGVWDRVFDCAGRGCQVPLPDSLATGPTRTRQLTQDWLAAQRQRYGFR